MGPIEIAKPTDEEAAINALQFVKVTIGGSNITMSGYLTNGSAKMLLNELRRQGFNVKRSD